LFNNVETSVYTFGNRKLNCNSRCITVRTLKTVKNCKNEELFFSRKTFGRNKIASFVCGLRNSRQIWEDIWNEKIWQRIICQDLNLFRKCLIWNACSNACFYCQYFIVSHPQTICCCQIKRFHTIQFYNFDLSFGSKLNKVIFELRGRKQRIILLILLTNRTESLPTSTLEWEVNQQQFHKIINKHFTWFAKSQRSSWLKTIF
jgi:hypothetical protein